MMMISPNTTTTTTTGPIPPLNHNNTNANTATSIHPSTTTTTNTNHHHHHIQSSFHPMSTTAAMITPTTHMSTVDISTFGGTGSGGIHPLPPMDMMNDTMTTTTQSHPSMSASSPFAFVPQPSTPIATNTTIGSCSSHPTNHPPPPPLSSSPQHETIDLYVVQKCWYSGPQITTPTLDYMRLLRTKEDAEQIAYHSAHLFATAMAASNASSHHNIVVRTITLPASSTAQQPNTIPLSNHAFVAAGQLFWIRRIRAQVVHPPTSSSSSSLSSSTTTTTHHFDHAHCIVTNGIIGGNGCNVRRRQFDESTSPAPMRVFVGSQSAHAALQLIVGHTTSMSHHNGASTSAPPVGSTVQWIPVGAPPSPTQILNEWSHAAQMTTAMTTTDDHNGLADVVMHPDQNSHPTFSKRTLQETDTVTHGTVWYNTTQTNPKPKNVRMEQSTTTVQQQQQNQDPFIWRPPQPSSTEPSSPLFDAFLPRPTKRPCCRSNTTTMELSSIMTAAASTNPFEYPSSNSIMDHQNHHSNDTTNNSTNMMMME